MRNSSRLPTSLSVTPAFELRPQRLPLIFWMFPEVETSQLAKQAGFAKFGFAFAIENRDTFFMGLAPYRALLAKRESIKLGLSSLFSIYERPSPGVVLFRGAPRRDQRS